MIADLLRDAKHRSALRLRALRTRTQRVRDVVYRTYDRLFPYRFERHHAEVGSSTEFLRTSLSATSPNADVPKRIFCFWTGEAPMSETRRAAFENLSRSQSVPVILITPDMLEQYVRPEHPLHPALPYLSDVQRSDYLRAYFMHYHGGGYTDVKAPLHDWGPAFDDWTDPQKWFVGYQEYSENRVGPVKGRIGREMRRHYAALCGVCAMIVRPGTPLTAEWLAEVERRMSYFQYDLARHPAQSPRDRSVHYPVAWARLCAEVLQPLQLKYLAHIWHDSRLLLDFDAYH